MAFPGGSRTRLANNAEKLFIRGFFVPKRLEAEPPRGRGIDQAVLHGRPEVVGGKGWFR